MGLEFKINDVELGHERQLNIEVYNGDFKGIQFEVNGKGKSISFDTISLEEILELGLMVNCHIGFDLFNISRLESEIRKEANKNA